MPGATRSKAEVTNISTHGFWVLVDDRELYLPFEEFPWFRQATVEGGPAEGPLTTEPLYFSASWMYSAKGS